MLKNQKKKEEKERMVHEIEAKRLAIVLKL